MFSVTLGLVLLGAFFVAGLQMMRRVGVRPGRLSPTVFLVGSSFASTLGFTLFYLANWGWTLPDNLEPRFWNPVILAALANVLIQGFNAKAASYPLGEVSYTTPLQAMTPALLTISALVAGEMPGLYGWMGVMVMMAGSYLLSFPKPPEKWWQYLSPLVRAFALFRKSTDERERQQAIVTMLALGSAAFGTLGLIGDGMMVRRAGDLQGIVLGSMVIVATIGTVYLVPLSMSLFTSRPRVSVAMLEHGRSITLFALGVFAVYAILWVIHVLLIQPQFGHTYLAYVASFKRFSVLFAVIMAALFFKEKDIKKRFFAAILIVAGAVLIGLDPAPAQLSGRLSNWGF